MTHGIANIHLEIVKPVTDFLQQIGYQINVDVPLIFS